MKKLLAIRFSAMGDVAMTVPVIASLARRYPDVEITMLTRPFLQPLFALIPSNVKFKGINLKDNCYKGISGIHRIYKDLEAENYDYIADLHDVLRTQLLRTFFFLHGKKVRFIHKGRAARKAILHHPERSLPTSFQRYADVFQRLGLPVEISFHSIYDGIRPDYTPMEAFTGKKNDDAWVGIAPFAAHKGKIYPLEKMERVVSILAKREHIHLFLFGAGTYENELLNKWEQCYPHTTNVGTRSGGLENELLLMSRLNVMVSMDSANMHLASLTGTPVVSIWGATHPNAGFLGWHQRKEDTVQLNLSCRPCSIFGNKPCKRGDYACLYDLPERAVLQRIQTYL